jgi:hypothetical protein
VQRYGLTDPVLSLLSQSLRARDWTIAYTARCIVAPLAELHGFVTVRGEEKVDAEVAECDGRARAIGRCTARLSR